MSNEDIFNGPIPSISKEDAISDIKYFSDKLKACEDSGDAAGANTYKRRLAQMEDAIIIYRLTREPDRSVETIDVGNLSKEDAEKKVKELMTRYRERNLQNPPNNEPNA